MDGSPPKGAGPGADLRQPHAEPRRPHARVRDQRTDAAYGHPRGSARPAGADGLARAHVFEASRAAELADAGHKAMDPARALADRTDADSLGDARARRVLIAARRHPGDLAAIEQCVVERGGDVEDLALAVRYATEIDAESAARAVRLVIAARRALMDLVGPGPTREERWHPHVVLALDGLSWLQHQRDRGDLDVLSFGELTLRTIGQLADALRDARRSAA